MLLWRWTFGGVTELKSRLSLSGLCLELETLGGFAVKSGQDSEPTITLQLARTYFMCHSCCLEACIARGSFSVYCLIIALIDLCVLYVADSSEYIIVFSLRMNSKECESIYPINHKVLLSKTLEDGPRQILRKCNCWLKVLTLENYEACMI